MFRLQKHERKNPMASIAARVLFVGYTVALSMIMMGRGDLVWRAIAYGHYFMLREINKPWPNPSIFKH